MNYSTKYNRTGFRAFRLIAIFASLLPLCTTVRAQQAYTISNGEVRWLLNNTTEVPLGQIVNTEGDTVDYIPASYGSQANMTILTRAGGIDADGTPKSGGWYLALSIDGAGNGSLVKVSTNEFTPRCVWQRTPGSAYYSGTGKYYQEVGNYRYFLMASRGTLTVQRYAIGEDLEGVTKFYDWDFGMAIEENPVVEGKRQENFYWVWLKNNVWSTSTESTYERPETRIYNDATGSTWEYYQGADMEGVGAVFVQVDSTVHGTEMTNITDGKGLDPTNITLSSADPLTYGNSLTATPVIDLTGTVQATFMPPYVHYVVDRERRQISTYWRNRTGDGANMSGVARYTEQYYYYPANPWADPSPSNLVTQHNAAPASDTRTITAADIQGVSYSINNGAKRYLTLTPGKSSGGLTYNDYVTIACISVPTATTATLTVTVDYGNGVTQTADYTIDLSAYVASSVPAPSYAPVVVGAVFGGGRMANVGTDAQATGSSVTVHNADYLNAVFGGNDISGEVKGTSGATVLLGTANTARGLHIAEVYGGGNGFYDYPGLDQDDVDASHTTFTTTAGDKDVVRWKNSTSDPTVVEHTFAADETYNIPAVLKTSVTVANDYVIVDSLFGGAKNAFVTTDATAVTLLHQGGTVYAEFGGNNYGGAFDDDATIAVTVSNTKTTGAKVDRVVNTYFQQFGREYGIRYLFGGGNRVAAPNVELTITGGMIDTAFLGGNRATVTGSATGTVNCAGLNNIFHNPTLPTTAGEIEAWNPTAAWVGGKGYYNVRCLFGGNNAADMAILPTMTLVAGGIGTVYGGGNAGDMNYAGALPATVTSDNSTYFTAANRILGPGHVGTFVEMASNDINIDYLYGGCRQASVLNSTYLRLVKGNVGTVFGGCNISGDVGSYGAVNEGTYILMTSADGDSVTVWNTVYAGANGGYHCSTPARINAQNVYVYTPGINFKDNDSPREAFDYYDDYLDGTTPIPTHDHAHLLFLHGKVHGNVYAGANLANVGFSAQVSGPSVNQGTAHLTMTGGQVRGNVFGGGNMASIYGLSYLYVAGNVHIDGSLYAGNDKRGRVENFGGYRDYAGTYTGTTSNGMALNSGENANYSSYLLLEQTPVIRSVYGSGNGAYNYDGLHTEYGDQIEFCGSVQEPEQQSCFIDIHTAGGMIDTVFGGGNGVSVENSTTVLFNSAAPSLDNKTVGTIFGGNNRDLMQVVPTVSLLRGKVGDVYGGGNSGNMTGHMSGRYFTDICGNRLIDSISTYVEVNSENVIVDGYLFGGCNMADVENMAYIRVRGTATNGIDTIFGGNNISGTVGGNTRIDLEGGYVNTIYGGSNGYFDYVEVAGDTYDVYEFGHGGDPNYLIAEGTSGWPNVAVTRVNIFGGTVRHNVFGGGRMGNCENTYVVVNDTVCHHSSTAVIEGTIFGGGEGNVTNLNLTHRGNVTVATHVDLYHADQLLSAKAYGGGKGGDVTNTYITVHDGWEEYFEEIYGGCWGSDVLGTAHLTMDGKEEGGAQNALAVFGGNDFTGNVYRCELTINSGRYGAIYGAGNGNYSDLDYTAGVYSTLRRYVPNAEYVVVNFNNGIVDSNLYGGGRLGTTMTYRKDPVERTYLLDGNGRYIPDSLFSVRNNIIGTTVNGHEVIAPYSDPLDYSYTIVNVHGGTFYRNIFAGGAGDDKQLVYGLKILNMDGGEVMESVYGGSEKVHDGYGSRYDYKVTGTGSTAETTYYYRGECIEPDSTTMRPSSVLNLAAGRVRGHVYGGGYLGNVFGSVYINVGLDAIENSKVWTTAYQYEESSNTVGSAANAYAIFKPNTAGELSTILTATGKHLLLNKSIYGGANWGEGTGNYIFDARGFYGGENRIFIDGHGYNTTGLEEENTYPEMTIGHSLIGSGTSALGGDVVSRIDVQNYGVSDANTCHAYKKLYSVQRADSVWLWNTGIYYQGSSTAASAYPSAEVTFNLIGSLNMRGYNMAELKAMITNVGDISFYENDPDGAGNLVLTTAPALAPAANCSTETMCQKLVVIDRETAKYTAIVVNNGVNIDVINANGDYGSVHGYAYLLAANGTNAVVSARVKLNGTGDGQDDGGFRSFCADSNMYYIYNGGASGTDNYTTAWMSTNGGSGWSTDPEYPFENYNENTYRVWSVGKGIRTRYAVILAHANPDKMDENKTIRVTDGHGTERHLSLAHALLELPPSAPGNYYRISGGITTHDDNNALILTDSTWNPVNWATVQNDTWATAENNGGYWAVSGSPVDGTATIVGAPDRVFGLLMSCGTNFSNDMPAAYSSLSGSTVVTGNAHANVQSSYCSQKVGDQSNTVPTMDLYLTYDNNFANTMLASVEFRLQEYTETGVPVGEVKVYITIATIIETFRDIEQDVLAMYNEGRTNEFVRKVVLPATLQHRDVYLTGVSWYPTEFENIPALDIKEGMGTTFTPTSKLFTLTNQQSVIDNEENANVFRVSLLPSDNISSTVNSTIGWHTVTLADVDAYTQAIGAAGTDSMGMAVNPIPSTGAPISFTGTSTSAPTTINLKTGEPDSKTGVKIGELDGRGMAALNIQLNFDGNKIYPELKGSHYLGKVVFTLETWVGMQSGGTFTVTAYVKSRARGDTIYLASANEVARTTCLLDAENHQQCSTYRVSPAPASAWVVDETEQNGHSSQWIKDNVGKTPGMYVQSFTQAFNPRIYEEGDVIAIIDQVNIPTDSTVSIHGSAYYAVDVVRYEGHHNELPGEDCVYRGAMINLSGSNSSFVATDINFKGSSLGKVADLVFQRNTTNVVADSIPQYAGGPYYHPDTNAVYGPIIAVTGSDNSVYLGNNVNVQDNYNIYTGATTPAGITCGYGAISVTDGAELHLQNDVTIENNIVPDTRPLISGTTIDTDHPTNGAVYLNGGKIVMEDSYEITAVTITDNYLMPEPEVVFWTPVTDDNAHTIRYDFVGTNLTDKANVFLTRTAPTSGSANELALRDVHTDYIEIFEDNTLSLPTGTRIGISKWFPGPTQRDTIRVVDSKVTAFLLDAYTNGNFSSDNPADGIFYNYYIATNKIFLQRCASFRHQLLGEPIPDLENRYASIATDNVLDYLYNERATCPTAGSDAIVYRVQGGFMPYTYTWSGDATRTRNTSITNATVQAEVNASNFDNFLDAIADTLAVPGVTLDHSLTASETLNFTVTATDAVGCTLTKDIEITFNRNTSGSVEPLVKTLVGGKDGWADTATVPGEKVTATANRNFKGIQVVPMVWSDRAGGIITAFNPSDDIVYWEDALSDRHDFENMAFCEGEEFILTTMPTLGSGNKFIMWDFDPYYNNRVHYIVPAYNDTVVAFYGPNDYWREAVNTTALANSHYDEHFTYGGRNGNSYGYVTTYRGDVHIYDENGLAWFISVVNGLNGTQARSFFFNKVYLHAKSDGTPYEMKAHLWTPVGTPQHRFRGSFIGVSSDDTDTLPASTPVVVKNIIVDEPNVDYTGFFGFLDEATIKSVELRSALVRGAQFVGTMAASATRTHISNTNITNASEEANTVLVTHYASGGMAGRTDHSFIDQSTTNVKYVGDAVYTGGMVGTGISTTVVNSAIRNVNRMEAVYAGGVSGSLDGQSNVEPNNYTITASSANDTMGTVQILLNGVAQASPATFNPGTTGITIVAVPANNYYFDHWSDGSTEAQYVVGELQSSINLVAYFTTEQPVEYTVTVNILPNDNPVAVGTVEGAGTYRADANLEAEATLVAQPNENAGYIFSQWSYTVAGVSQTSTEPTLHLTLTGDITVTATFATGGKRRGAKEEEDHRNYVMNNYVHFNTGRRSQRVGGLVGYSRNTIVENNYVYGQLDGRATEAGVGAVIDEGTQATHNYYEHSAVTRSVGQTRNGASAHGNTDFTGQGNQVTLATPSYGINNLTRALNIWVREHGAAYRTWRSDLEGTNNGYPLFGAPDLIPVSDSIVVSGCDSVEWNGVVYLFDDELVSHIVDSVQMIDSTTYLHIAVHHSSREIYTDSVDAGSSYHGYGFDLTPTEIALLLMDNGTQHSTLMLHDTLQSVNGCDSIVTLWLVVRRDLQEIDVEPAHVPATVNVYPNPTTARVTVESTETISHVELYDNEGRRLQDYNTRESNSITIDVTPYASGAYYLRVHGASGITIQKLIKK